MFTGIVRAIGVVRALQRGPDGARLKLDAPDLPRPIEHGASICVNGACLTAIQSDSREIAFDIVPETLSRSTLGSLHAGQRVNLEPSLRLGDPMHGHQVQGHVDGTARIESIQTGPEGHEVTISADSAMLAFIIPKGSIAVDGVSLTVADVGQASFRVALVPTTLSMTTLGGVQIGDRVNIETDILARTIVTTLRRLQGSAARPELTEAMLRENGW